MKRTHRYIIYRVTEDKTQIVIEKIGERDAPFEEFKESRPKDSCR